MPLRLSKKYLTLKDIPLNLSPEVDVIAYTSTPIGDVTVLSNNIRITGTIQQPFGIANFGFAGFAGSAAAGTDRYLRFAEILTIIHNATSLILPGGIDIITAPGDTAHFVCLGSAGLHSAWLCRNYTRANGQAVAVVPLVDLTAQVNNWTKGQRGFVTPLNDASTIAINLANSNNFSLLMTSGIGATRILGIPTNIVAGQSGIIAVTQDGTGSKALTYGTGTLYKFAEGVAPVLSTGAGMIDYLVYCVETTSRIFVSIIKDVK